LGDFVPKGHMGDSHLVIIKLMKKLSFVIVLADKCSYILVEAIVLNTFKNVYVETNSIPFEDRHLLQVH